MTDQYLTVKEALRGWLNGETLQWRFPDYSPHELYDPKNNPWRSLLPTKGVIGIAIDTSERHYRFKPKPREFYLIAAGDSLAGVPVARLYEYYSDARADKEQYDMTGEIIHVREVLPE
jgi:hypothetical protein